MDDNKGCFGVIIVILIGIAVWYFFFNNEKPPQKSEPAAVRDEPIPAVAKSRPKRPSISKLYSKMDKAEAAIWRFENRVCLECRGGNRMRFHKSGEFSKELKRMNDILQKQKFPNPSNHLIRSRRYDFYRKWVDKINTRMKKVNQMTNRYYGVSFCVSGRLPAFYR